MDLDLIKLPRKKSTQKEEREKREKGREGKSTISGEQKEIKKREKLKIVEQLLLNGNWNLFGTVMTKERKSVS